MLTDVHSIGCYYYYYLGPSHISVLSVIVGSSLYYEIPIYPWNGAILRPTLLKGNCAALLVQSQTLLFSNRLL